MRRRIGSRRFGEGLEMGWDGWRGRDGWSGRGMDM